MYELKRSGKVHDEIKIGDDILKIDISPEAIFQNYRKRQIDLLKAEQQVKEYQKHEINEDFDAALDTYGAALVSMFQLIFGEDGTKKILEFYEGRYVEMAEQVVPYIVEKIAPQIQNLLDQQRARIKQKYVFKNGGAQRGK